jgi:hypothetical protein
MAKPSRHPVDVGQQTEATIVAELLRRGFRVLTPSGPNQRYDLVLDLDCGFVRVQCKTGRLRRGVINFSTQSVQSNRSRRVTRGYAGEADVFVVHCASTNRIYAIPVDEAPVGYMNLRVDATKNGQLSGVRWAAEYELPG